jgi:hypothetical protein
MKTRLLAVFLIISNLLSYSNAQIGNEIKSYVDSTEMFMNNGRKLLLRSFEEGDILKARKVYFYLQDEAAKKKCSVFSYTEEFYIYTLISDWTSWFNHAEKYMELRNKRVCYNFNDNLSESLYKFLADEAEAKTKETDLENFTPEQRDLMNLYMQLLSNGKADEEYYIKARIFLKKYKNSGYHDFANYFLPTPPTMVGLTMGAGPTFTAPTGNLSEVLQPSTLFNFSYDFFINRFYASLFMNGGATQLKVPVYFTDNNGDRVDFAPNDYFSTFSGGLSVGYILFMNKSLKLIPYLSIGGYTIESNLYQNEYDPEFILLESFFYGPGLQAEVRLFNFDWKTNYLFAPYTYGMAVGSQKSYVSLKINAGYDIITKTTPVDFKGNFPYLRLGLVWGFGEL